MFRRRHCERYTSPVLLSRKARVARHVSRCSAAQRTRRLGIDSQWDILHCCGRGAETDEHDRGRGGWRAGAPLSVTTLMFCDRSQAVATLCQAGSPLCSHHSLCASRVPCVRTTVGRPVTLLPVDAHDVAIDSTSGQCVNVHSHVSGNLASTLPRWAVNQLVGHGIALTAQYGCSTCSVQQRRSSQSPMRALT